LTEIDDLVRDATVVSPSKLLGLIRHVTALIIREQEEKGPLKVRGKLVLMPPLGEATIVGDLHGNLKSLTHIIRDSSFLKKVQNGKDVYLIFLGDYGDRGASSPEVYYVILKLKELFPERVVLMRGNHEGPADLLPMPHDLPTQLMKYGEMGANIYMELQKLFDNLYNAVIVDKSLVLIHGCFPSNASSIEDLAFAHEKHPRETHLEEMLWSDPAEDLVDVRLSPRGAGKLQGIRVTEKLLKMLSVNFLIRSHQFCEEGFKTNHNGKILTVFSTNGSPYNNRYGAYLQLNLAEKIQDTAELVKHIRQFT